MMRIAFFLIVMLVSGCSEQKPKSASPVWKIRLMRPSGHTMMTWSIDGGDRPRPITSFGNGGVMWIEGHPEISAPAGWLLDVRREE